MLANPDFDFPIAVICGEKGEYGGNSDCLDFIKVNKNYQEEGGAPLLITIEGVDDDFSQKGVLIQEMKAFLNGT